MIHGKVLHQGYRRLFSLLCDSQRAGLRPAVLVCVREASLPDSGRARGSSPALRGAENARVARGRPDEASLSARSGNRNRNVLFHYWSRWGNRAPTGM